MGSEMCIRDRARGARRRRDRDLGAAHAGVRGRGAAAVHAARPGTCLLYTSDAADERSSVDLGGRRIIKKKNSDTSRQRPN